MASASKYEWRRSDGTVGRAWRAKWQTPAGPRYKRGFDRKGDAVQYAQDREAEARHGLRLGDEPVAGGTTVEAFAATWLAGLDLRPSSVTTYQARLAHALAQFGARPLASVRKSEVMAWQRGLESKLAATTAAHTASIFGMLMRAAVDDELIGKSPVPAKRTKGGAQVVLTELLTEAQVLAWGDAMPPHARVMPLVAATTGLRQGELLGLRLPQVDFLRRQVRVTEQLQSPYGAGRPDWCPPKTRAGLRTVPLTAVALDALSQHLAAFPPVDGEPLFRTSRGGRWRRGSFGQVWAKAKAEAVWQGDDGKPVAGLPSWAHWHALRDVAASTWLAQGLDSVSVATILGHASTDELRVYTRPTADHVERGRRAMDAAWSAESTEADAQ